MRSRRPPFKPPSHVWRAWFAWYPVRTLSGQWVWLERVEWRNDVASLVALPVYRLPDNTDALKRQI